MKATRVTSGGRQLTYLQLVESYRDGGRVRQRVIAKLGREDELDRDAIERLVRSLAKYADVDVGAGNVLDEVELLPGLAFGHVHALEHVWNDLLLGDIVRDLAAGRRFRFDVVNVIKAIVFQRVLDPGSERSLVRSFLPSVYAPELEGIELQHAYRALQFLAEVGPELEARLTGVMTERLFADASLVLFDTTSTYFEGAGPEELASFGFSRDKRGDRPQANLALLTSREGLPLGHWLYPGKQSDVRSMAEASREFRARLGLGSFVVVADRGMISAETIAALERLGMEYILDARERSSSVVRDIVLEDEAAMVPLVLERQKGETQLWVKEVRVGTGKSAQRYIVSVNEAEAEKDKADRQAIIAGLEAQLKKGDKALVGNSAYRRYLRKTAKDKAFEIDAGKLAEEARFDGVTVLRTNAKVTQHRPDRRHVEARARLAAQIAGGRDACRAACRLLRCLHVGPTCSASPTSRPLTASCREALEYPWRRETHRRSGDRRAAAARQ